MEDDVGKGHVLLEINQFFLFNPYFKCDGIVQWYLKQRILSSLCTQQSTPNQIENNYFFISFVSSEFKIAMKAHREKKSFNYSSVSVGHPSISFVQTVKCI